jgi:uncharacterized membrane protein YwzB
MHYLFRQAAIAVGVFLLLIVVGLWSWNTLSELFNFPHAQYRHAVAAMILLLITGGTLRSSHGHLHGNRQRDR